MPTFDVRCSNCGATDECKTPSVFTIAPTWPCECGGVFKKIPGFSGIIGRTKGGASTKRRLAEMAEKAAAPPPPPAKDERVTLFGGPGDMIDCHFENLSLNNIKFAADDVNIKSSTFKNIRSV